MYDVQQKPHRAPIDRFFIGQASGGSILGKLGKSFRTLTLFIFVNAFWWTTQRIHDPSCSGA